jgi:hypothetical protein
MGAISSKGSSNMSCSTKASRSDGLSVSSTTINANPTESAIRASSSGLGARSTVTIGSGSHEPAWSSRRARRARSMSRETRPTTVVSQAPRFSTAASSVRLKRSQASWTASSASSSVPSMR